MMFSFNKEERIYKRNDIETLFSKGVSFFSFPFKVLWHQTESSEKYPVRLLISVPKKYHKLAVSRNRLKRLIREAYRKNKSILYEIKEFENKQLHLALIYTHKEILTYQEVEKQIIKVLNKIKKEYEKSTN
ncbi:MAG: ribonuclease P protein component [Bacteroidetes bacterium]|nr:ribonuclease P protein component [Bacteroidota bacterium]